MYYFVKLQFVLVRLVHVALTVTEKTASVVVTAVIK